jgi:hypothetical protein
MWARAYRQSAGRCGEFNRQYREKMQSTCVMPAEGLPVAMSVVVKKNNELITGVQVSCTEKFA